MISSSFLTSLTGIVSEITSNAELWNNFYNDPYAENSIPFDFLNKHREAISNEKDQKIAWHILNAQ